MLRQSLPILLLLVTQYSHAQYSDAQCGYGATLLTNKDNCIGSSIIVKSSHALKKIIWYKDGAIVGTVIGTNSFDPKPKTVAGGHGVGTNANQVWPSAVFVDTAGNIYLTDTYNHRVQKWAPGAAAGITVAGGNGAGSAADQFNFPMGLFVDHDGNTYIGDQNNNRVQKWSPGASQGITVAGGNGQGNGAGQLAEPAGVFVTCNGDIYIADYGNYRVQKWPAGASQGITLAGGNPASTGPDELVHPYTLAFDGAGILYIDCTGYLGIRVLPPGASSPTAIGPTINGSEPFGMVVTKAGDIYAIVQTLDEVLLWPHGGTSWQTILHTGLPVGAQYSSTTLSGLCMDVRGNLYIGDIDRYSVLEFQRHTIIDSAFTPSASGKYSAMVIDLNDDTTTTQPIIINSPFTGPPPSISITATATNIAVCTPVTFSATPVNPGPDPTYQWQVSGVDVGDGSLQYNNNIFADNDRVYCIMTTDTGCSATRITDTSNIITLSVDPQGHATVSITASDTAVCIGTPITFDATVSNGSASPVFEWLANGATVGDGSSTWVDSNTVGPQAVYCLITSDASCGLAKSNTIPVTIYPLPVVAPNQVFNIPYGKSMQLDPAITGSIQTYNWSPAIGLSDTTVRNPIADPTTSITYTLSVTSYGGCKTSGPITVDIYTPLGLPNAFSPNGDGHNDVLYVLGGPTGSLVKEFAIFNRWGQCLFKVHDAPPGDPAFGWKGFINGSPAPPETYIYMVVMKYAGGARQVYKGTVILVR